jgi:hypothetical protein
MADWVQLHLPSVCLNRMLKIWAPTDRLLQSIELTNAYVSAGDTDWWTLPVHALSIQYSQSVILLSVVETAGSLKNNWLNTLLQQPLLCRNRTLNVCAPVERLLQSMPEIKL